MGINNGINYLPTSTGDRRIFSINNSGLKTSQESSFQSQPMSDGNVAACRKMVLVVAWFATDKTYGARTMEHDQDLIFLLVWIQKDHGKHDGQLCGLHLIFGRFKFEVIVLMNLNLPHSTDLYWRCNQTTGPSSIIQAQLRTWLSSAIGSGSFVSMDKIENHWSHPLDGFDKIWEKTS